MGDLLISQERDPETHAIIGAAMEVHRELGPGFLEPVYQEALMMEFVQRQIPAKREVALVIHYKDKEMDCFYRADFICYDRIVVEIKALAQIGGNEEAQVINYLRANGTYLSAFAREYGTRAIKGATRSPHAAQRNAGEMLSRGADPRIALRSIRATYRGCRGIRA